MRVGTIGLHNVPCASLSIAGICVGLFGSGLDGTSQRVFYSSLGYCTSFAINSHAGTSKQGAYTVAI